MLLYSNVFLHDHSVNAGLFSEGILHVINSHHKLDFMHRPPKLTPGFPRLPPILYMHYRSSVLSYSKAPWGLSV